MTQRYRGFISYNQKDKARARKLHVALESYRVPKGIDAEGVDPKTRRIGRFFRDDDDLGAGTSLGAALEGALDDSRNLIVVCSPRSARSSWVDLEVRRFKSQPDGHVFGVVIAGKPNSGDAKTECFCPALKEDIGGRRPLKDGQDEPFAPDWRKDGLARVRVRLVAGLLNINFASLWNRDRHRARLRYLQAAAGVLVLMIGGLAGLTWLAVGQSRQASLTQSQRLIERAASAGDSGRLMSALRISLAASRSDEVTIAAPGADAAIARAAQALQGIVELDGVEGASELRVSPDGRRVLGLHATDQGGATVSVWDTTTGAVLGSQHYARGDDPMSVMAIKEVGSSPTSFFIGDGARVLTWGGDTSVRVWEAASGKEISRQDQGGDIYGATASPDGSRAFSWSRNGDVRLWDTGTGKVLAKPAQSVAAAVFTSDGKYLKLSAQTGSKETVWFDSSNGQEIQPAAELRAAALAKSNTVKSPDGSRVLVWGSADGAVTLEDAKSGKVLVKQYHEKWVWGGGFSPDGKLIVSRSEDGEVKVWKADSGEEISHQDHAEFVEGAEFSSDARLILSWGRDGTARVWDAATGVVLAQQSGGRSVEAAFLPEDRFVVFGDSIARVVTYGREGLSIIARLDPGTKAWSSAFSPDGKRVLSLGEDAIVRVWDAQTGLQISRQQEVDEEGLLGAQFTPDGSRILSWGRFGLIVVFDAATGKTVIAKEAPVAESDSGATLSPDGSRVLEWSDVGQACVFSPSNLGDIACQESGVGLGGRFSADGKRILSYGWEKAALWNAVTGKVIAEQDHGEDYMGGAIFSPDEKRILSWGVGTVRVWDAATGEILSLPKFAANGALFSSDGARVLSWDRRTVRLWAAANGKELASHQHGGVVNGAVFSTDGRRILSWDTKGIATVWDAATGATIAEQDHGACDDFDGTGCVSPAFVSGDARVLSWGFDGSVRLWDAATGKEIVRHRHSEDIQSVEGAVMLADGARVLSWGSSLDLWDAATGQLISRQTHGGDVYGAVVSADGERILSWGENGVPRIWNVRVAAKADGEALGTGEICKARLAVGGVYFGRITEADIKLAPELKDRFGEDVCQQRSLWQQLWSAFVQLVSPRVAPTG